MDNYLVIIFNDGISCELSVAQCVRVCALLGTCHLPSCIVSALAACSGSMSRNDSSFFTRRSEEDIMPLPPSVSTTGYIHRQREIYEIYIYERDIYERYMREIYMREIYMKDDNALMW